MSNVWLKSGFSQPSRQHGERGHPGIHQTPTTDPQGPQCQLYWQISVLTESKKSVLLMRRVIT